VWFFFFFVILLGKIEKRKKKKRGGGGGGGGAAILVYLNYVWKIHDFCYLREILAIENLKNHFILAIILFYLTF